jgi:general secretion pathway protein I
VGPSWVGGILSAAKGERRPFVGVSRADGIVSGVAVRSAQRGYTLVEVIVAFGVLALGLVLLLGTLSGATRQVRNADEAGRAALHAQSLLDQVGVGQVLQPGRRDGEFEDGHYRWTLDVRPFREPGVPPPALDTPGAPQLLELALTVHWGDDARQRLQLRSLRLVAPDATGGSAIP